MKKLFFIALCFLIFPLPIFAAEHLFHVSQNSCKPGLYQQPNGGPFTVWLFCDDALGSNIGVINNSPAAGPGNIPLPHPREWAHWQTYDRFWQERAWAADITSFAWSPDLKYLYVATDSIYGSGGIYRLDLTNRKAIDLRPKEASTKIHSTLIKSISHQSGTIIVEAMFHNKKSGKRGTKEYKLK